MSARDSLGESLGGQIGVCCKHDLSNRSQMPQHLDVAFRNDSAIEDFATPELLDFLPAQTRDLHFLPAACCSPLHQSRILACTSHTLGARDLPAARCVFAWEEGRACIPAHVLDIGCGLAYTEGAHPNDFGTGEGRSNAAGVHEAAEHPNASVGSDQNESCHIASRSRHLTGFP